MEQKRLQLLEEDKNRKVGAALGIWVKALTSVFTLFGSALNVIIYVEPCVDL